MTARDDPLDSWWWWSVTSSWAALAVVHALQRNWFFAVGAALFVVLHLLQVVAHRRHQR